MPVKIGADAPGTAVQLIGDTVAPRILMIVTDKDNLDSDTEITLRRDLVSRFNAQIDVAQSDVDIDSGNWDLKRYDLIIVCNGVVPTDVNNLKTVEVPVLSLDEDVSVTALNMAATGGTATTETQTNATDITHQIISEAIRTITPTSIVAGNKTVYRTSSSMDFISTLGAGGVSLAEDTGTAAEEQIIVYEEDAVLQDASLAAEMRLHFGIYQFNQLNATGKALFRQVVEYAIYGGVPGIVEVETDVDTILANQDNNQNFGVRVGGFLPQGQELSEAIFVQTTGLDTNTGVSWALSVLTIDYAVGLAGVNGYIFVGRGSFDEDANTTGVNADVVGQRIFGMEWGSTNVVNSNAAATVVIIVTAVGCEIAGIGIPETTVTVEGIYHNSGGQLHIHHVFFNGTQENGVTHLAGTQIYIEKCEFSGMTNDGVESITSGCRIWDSRFHAIGDNAIHLNSNNSDVGFVYNNRINGSAGMTDVGILCTLGDNNEIVGNKIFECVTPTLDTGSNNAWDNKFDQISGSFSREVADGVGEETGDIDDIDLPAPGLYYVTLEVAALDAAGEGGNIDMFLYKKVNPASYEEVDTNRFAQGADRVHMTTKATYKGGSDRLRASHTTSVAVTAPRLMYFTIEHA